MAPIRQKLRPGVADFLARCVESSRWRGFPSRGGDAKQPIAVVGTTNHAVTIPCSVPALEKGCRWSVEGRCPD